MLNLDPRYRDGLPRYVQSLDSSGRDDEIFELAFGRPFERAMSDLRAYVPRMAAANIDAPALDPLPPFRPEPVTAAGALVLRADLALRMGKQPLAAQLFQQAARDYPETAAAALGLGSLASAQGRVEEARSHLDRATKLDPRNGSAWFELAMLEQETGAGSERVTALLDQAVAANPNLGQAQVLLGVRASDAGQYSVAAQHLEQAARLLPRKSDVWQALAFVQDRLGLPAAEKSAVRAVRTAVTPDQAIAAETLLSGLANR
jgi:tetratricopeptide (TPR) repeat protein